MKTQLNKTNAPTALADYAEAWRVKAVAEKELERAKEAMLEILADGPAEYTYLDGAKASFQAVEGFRTNPVGYAEAKAITGFGEANMARIAGPVSAKAVEALVELGKLGADVASKLLPKAGYTQIRGNLKK